MEWVGPGRVVFHEVLPYQDHEDDRRHIVWFLVAKQLLRCSVHSVRPVTELERVYYEVTTHADPTRWKSLTDLLPQRDYVDITDQVLGDDEIEEADLPDIPDLETTGLMVSWRLHEKQRVPEPELIPQSLRRPFQEARESGMGLDDVNDYEPSPDLLDGDVDDQETQQQLEPAPKRLRPEEEEDPSMRHLSMDKINMLVFRAPLMMLLMMVMRLMGTSEPVTSRQDHQHRHGD